LPKFLATPLALPVAKTALGRYPILRLFAVRETRREINPG
jgi:hypothetical protein